jgi:hypothetical protein
LLQLIGRLAFFAWLVFLACGGIAVLVELLRGRIEKARLVALALSGASGLYLIVLIAASLLSREVVLPIGTEKSICGLDCDLHFSVISARRVPEALAIVPGRTRWWVEIRARSDARRVDMNLAPFQVFAVGERGARFVAIDPMSGAFRRRPFDGALAPGQTDTLRLAFDVPDQTMRPRLLVTDEDIVSRFVLGDEASLFHRPILFSLESEVVAGERTAPLR